MTAPLARPAALSHPTCPCMQMVNLQSNDEFASHQLNRDTWSNPTVKSTIQNSFIFWQARLHLCGLPALMVS